MPGNFRDFPFPGNEILTGNDQPYYAVILLGYIFIISKVTHGDDFNMIVGELTLTQTGWAI